MWTIIPVLRGWALSLNSKNLLEQVWEGGREVSCFTRSILPDA